MEWLKRNWVYVVVAVVVLAVVLYFALNRKVYYTDGALAYLQDMKRKGRLAPFGDTDNQAMWDNTCYKLAKHFGEPFCGNNITWKVDMGAALAWFKGMNVNPYGYTPKGASEMVRTELLDNPEILNSIYLYWNTVFRKDSFYWEKMPVGGIYNLFGNN